MRALVIGAGIGGLAAAVRLAHAGYDVEVHEALDRPGGRANLIERDGFRIDTGPSILLMRDIIEEVFVDVGRDPADYVDIRRLDPAYRVHFGDGTDLEVRVGFEAFGAELDRIEPGAGERFRDFAAVGDRLYRGARAAVVERNFPRLGDMLTPRSLAAVLRLRVHEPMHRLVGRYFRDERLRQLFTFNAMYIGMNPYTAPGVYALLPYNDTVEGVYFTAGGMYGVVEALVRLAGELGVRIRTGHPATSLRHEGGRIRGVVFPDGEETADLVVVNADWPLAQRRLLGREPRTPLRRRPDYGPSALNLYFGVRGPMPAGFRVHNVFFGPDFRANFADVFAGRPHPEPAYYVHVPSLADPSLAPPGHHAVSVLVPHSGTGAPIDWREETARVRRYVVADLARRGLDLAAQAVFEEVIDPPRWEDHFSLDRGATFGLSHGIGQVGWFRPHNRDDEIDGLYYVGSSTHPGAGVPMVMLSARLAVERILDDHRPDRSDAVIPSTRA